MRRNKLGLISCSLFFVSGALCFAILPSNNFSVSKLDNSSGIRADSAYSLTLNASNKYNSQNIFSVSTDRKNGSYVRFEYDGASQSGLGHVVLNNGGTLKNLDQLTSLSYFVPVFTAENGATLKFRASNDGINWGEYASIKPYSNEISSNSFSVPYMRYIEFKAEGGSVNIESITYVYTCYEGDNHGDTNYECGTTYNDENLTNYNINNSFNDFSDGLTISTKYNGGSTSVLNESSYDVVVKDSSGIEINKSSNLAKGTYTVNIIRKDRAFSDISYEFNVTAFSFNDDIKTIQKIHTTNQENFLNYSGDYYNITSSELNSYNALGTAENSFPNQVSLTWNYNVPSGKTLSKYSIVTGQEPDLSDGYTINGTTTKSISFYNPFLGTNYFKVIANFSDNTSEESQIKTFLVDGTAPRNLKIGDMSNCRDMGGRTTIAGGKIKQGLIYRTSDPSGQVTSDVTEQMINRFKVKSEIYVKDGGGTTSPLGNTVTYYNCSMDYGATPYSNLTRNAERLRKVFSVLGDENNYPTFYHCRIGTDRTGICGVTINGLLGVPFNEVIQDYAFSNFGKIDGQRYAHKTPDNNGDDAAKYIDEILALPGDNFQEQMCYALLSIGIPRQTLQNVIDILTEGPKVTVPTDIIVASGNDLTNNGGTKKTSSDYTNPDTYYQISGSSKSVSYTYNASEDKTVSILTYLGCTDSSSTKKLADGINLKIDGVSKTICDKTYLLSGFGTTKQASRTGYMFNLLGGYELSEGSHTIAIAGKNSDTFNIGSIIVIERGEATGGGDIDDPPVVDPPISQDPVEIASFLATDAYAKSGATSYTNNSGTYYKLGSNNNYIEYRFNSSVSGPATLKALVGTKSSNATSNYKLWYDGSSPKITFTVNNSNVSITDNTTTFAGAGMTNTKASGSSGSADSCVPVWVDFPQINLINGENVIRITRSGGYGLYYYEFKVMA